MEINSFDGLQIQARRRLEFSQDYGFVFVGPGKSFKLRETIYKGNTGTVVLGQNNEKLGLRLVLTREGSILSFILCNLRNAQVLKQLHIKIENNYINYHHVFRLCNDDSTFLFITNRKPTLRYEGSIH